MLFEFGLRSSLLLIFFTHLLVYAFLFYKRGRQRERLSDQLLGTFLLLSALLKAAGCLSLSPGVSGTRR